MSPLVPKEYEPGLIDEGGLPVRVRHIFDRYQQFMGSSVDASQAHSQTQTRKEDGVSAHQGQKTTSQLLASTRYTGKQLKGGEVSSDWSSRLQRHTPQGALPPTGCTDYSVDSIDMERGTSGPVIEVPSAQIKAGRQVQRQGLTGRAGTNSASLIICREEQLSLLVARSIACILSLTPMPVTAPLAIAILAIFLVSNSLFLALLLRLTCLLRRQLSVDRGIYRGIRGRERAGVRSCASLTDAASIAPVYMHSCLSGTCDSDGDILCKAFLMGRTLRATVPPLSEGRHGVSVRDSNSTTHRIQLGGLPGSSFCVPDAEALPLVVMVYPRNRKQPRLCYSVKGLRRSTEESSTLSNIPSGPYTAEELEEFVAATERQLWGGPNRAFVPLSSPPGRDTKGGEGRMSFDERLRKCLQMAYGQKQPLTRPAAGVAAFVPDDLSDCRVPLAFKASLYASCQPSTRTAVAYFHSQLFEFLPFGVVSAHLFMKSHPSDRITIFAFTLTPPDSAARTVPLGSDPPNVALLDRFEVSERLCADTRHWKHVDSNVPRKNSEAAAYVFSTKPEAQCPVPQSLRHSKNPFKDYPEGLEIAPFVYLYFEPWPSSELPVPVLKAPSANNTTRDSNSSGSVALRALAGGGSPAVREFGNKAEGEEEGAAQEGAGPYFSVTLCVGKLIFSTVVGVHLRVLTAIFNDWLKQVPVKKADAQQLIRAKLRHINPIAPNSPATQ